VLTGVNVGFGGIRTLGLQGPQDFIAVTDAAAFAAQDSHVRFLGGLWLGVGLLFAAGALRLRALRAPLMVALLLVVLGGLARFTTGDATALSPNVRLSLLAELVLMPVLFVWLALATRAQAGSAAPQ